MVIWVAKEQLTAFDESSSETLFGKKLTDYSTRQLLDMRDDEFRLTSQGEMHLVSMLIEACDSESDSESCWIKRLRETTCPQGRKMLELIHNELQSRGIGHWARYGET